MYSKIKNKLRFNRVTRIIRFKNRISANEACTYWLKNNKNKFTYEDNNINSFNLDITPIDQKPIPLYFLWANPVISRARFIYSFNNVVVSPYESHIYFYDIDKSTSDLGTKFDNDKLSLFDFYKKNELFAAKELKGNVLHLGISSNPSNFYHWIHEIYARILRIKKKYDLNKFDFVIMPKLNNKFQKEALELLEFDTSKILSSEKFYKCTGNLVTANIDIIASGLDLRNFFANNHELKSNKLKKYFLDRDSNSGIQKRELINFDRFKSKYKDAGFEFVKPEQLSFKEQLKIFLSAKSLVGVSGSAFCLVSLMNEGSKVVEIFSKSFVDPAISNICAASNLKYGFYIEDSYRPKIENNWVRDLNSKINADLIDHEKIIKFFI
ncbi:Hypothetical protein P9515_01531 [Prochlorococcus marinus str. MIT 9515]|uniref:Glycosyltransferase 61 catalytic domain-containing protein n=1 Tax=Prochlorococcus marinus (strain MIT 9515) TaxID=167542 RepID=A2BUA1_PROM5|nr:glycosyltransferase family 61 protein [Prochlorococcus marinus]ABM71362.1 Hypothetical protein P9515_01531 [Prochlorococcus marinus str. MIT 9515]